MIKGPVSFHNFSLLLVTNMTDDSSLGCCATVAFFWGGPFGAQNDVLLLMLSVRSADVCLQSTKRNRVCPRFDNSTAEYYYTKTIATIAPQLKEKSVNRYSLKNTILL